MAGTTIGIIDFSSQMTVYAPPGYAPFEQKCAVKSPHLTVNPLFWRLFPTGVRGLTSGSTEEIAQSKNRNQAVEQARGSPGDAWAM